MEEVYDRFYNLNNLFDKTRNAIGSAKSGQRLDLSQRLGLGHRNRTSLVMLSAAKLARRFSAARVARPTRCIYTSSPRHSDALFVVSPLCCPLPSSSLTLPSTLQHRDKPYNNPGVSSYIMSPFPCYLTPSSRFHSSSHLRTLNTPMKSSLIIRPNTRRQLSFPSWTLASGKTRDGRA
jgi:hypothetical protein